MIAKQVWPLVVRDMLARNEEGAVKYNRYLQTDCPDNMLQHAYEEALDLCVYLKTLVEKQAKQEWIKVKDFEEKTIKEATEQWTSNNINNGLSQLPSIPEPGSTDSTRRYTLPWDSSQKQEKLQEKSRKSYGEIMSIPMM